MPRSPRQPAFIALSAKECRAVLGRNHIGRFAFLNETIVDIEPVHYVAANSWIFMRSADGAKLDAFAHNPYVAFEVDEIDGPFDWRSVVVHGTIYMLADAGSHVDRQAFERALSALRSFIPETLTTADPTPFRDTVYGLHVDVLTGRAAEQRHRTPGRRPVRARKPARRPHTPSGF